jgi:hypothetical protein
MKSPAKTAAKAAKKGSSDWLSIGFICLLIGGTIGAKALLLVDNDLEIKTKFSGKTWQLNSQSIGQYVSVIENFASQKIKPLGQELRQQSSQILTRTGDALADRQDLCISTAEVSTVLAHAKRLTSLDVDPPAASKANLPTTTPTSKSGQTDRSTPTKIAPIQTNPAAKNWCITTGVKK